TDAAARAALGDAWWDAAGNLPEAQQRIARARAAAWYRRALPQLTGLAAAKTQTRIDEFAALGVPPAVLPGDTIDTIRLGGSGGGPFRELRPDHAPIVGFHMNFRVGCVKFL